ncbi:hypothetical protein JW752_03655 [Candidatus Peregrinibacteria bacterium]|nr:hypothetical protein [Candidatus Peregrinibacteria bacterium]
MTYSKLGEDHPHSENPFDFRPPAKLSFRQLGRLCMHIVQGLKIETEQGTETVQSLMDRAYAVVKKAECRPEADDKAEVQALPECIRDDTHALIRTVRMNLANLKDVREIDLSDIDDDGSICSW